MSPSKRKPLAIVCLAALVLYAAGYFVIRVNSLDDREWTGHKKPSSIFFGVWIDDTRFLIFHLDLSPAEEARHRKRIERRSQMLCSLYSPLIWIDEKTTGVLIKPQGKP